MLWVVDVIKVKEKAEILQLSTSSHQSPQLQPGSIPEVVLHVSSFFTPPISLLHIVSRSLFKTRNLLLIVLAAKLYL